MMIRLTIRRQPVWMTRIHTIAKLPVPAEKWSARIERRGVGHQDVGFLERRDMETLISTMVLIRSLRCGFNDGASVPRHR